MKVKELITLVNNNFFYSLHDLDEIENLPKCVAEGLELDQHRWYSTAINVYKCEDGFVGIWGIYQSFYEYQDYKDIGIKCVALEYEEVPSVTYKPKPG